MALDDYSAGPTVAGGVVAPMPPVVDPGHIAGFLDDYGPMLDLVPTHAGTDGKSLAPCWDRHPPAITELTGIFLAWSGLIRALGPDSAVVAGPREWMDLTNATVPARERTIAATRACHRAGKHVEASEQRGRAGE